MQRRTFIAGVGASGLLATAGCIDDVQEAAGMGPEYEEGDAEGDRMIPEPNSDWPDYGDIERNDDLNDHFQAAFVAEDESFFILMDADVEPSVEAAEERLSDGEARFTNVDEFSLADEAIVGEDSGGEIAIAGFRHSNAIGQAAAGRSSGFEVNPDRSRAMTYAEIMYDHWQTI